MAALRSPDRNRLTPDMIRIVSGEFGPLIFSSARSSRARTWGCSAAPTERYRERAGRRAATLVIAGAPGWRAEEDLALIDRLRREGKLVWFRGASDDQLLLLYNAASLLVLPSRYEGFGLTAIEAMACGTPAPGLEPSSLPEVVGEAGVLAAPRRSRRLGRRDARGRRTPRQARDADCRLDWCRPGPSPGPARHRSKHSPSIVARRGTRNRPSPPAWWNRGSVSRRPRQSRQGLRRYPPQRRLSLRRTPGAARGAHLERPRLKAEQARGTIAGRDVVLAKPTTYMNLSGVAVTQLVRWYKVPPDQLLIVHDDLDLPFGQIRLRTEGSAGGQNGMVSIIEQLGTKAIHRLKIGIGRPSRGDPKDYVLARFTKEQAAELPYLIDRAADAVELWLTEGIIPAMNKFNITPARS